MKPIKLTVVLTLATLSVSACQKTTYTYTPPMTKAAKKCIKRCGAEQKRCLTKGSIEYQQCRYAAIDAAKPAYQTYVQNRQNQKKSVDKTLNNFVDLSNCGDHYNCTSAYNQCYNICGGDVSSH